MRNVGIVVVSLLLSLLGTGGARAQATLDGLPLVAQWTDFENQAGELPVNIWGQCAARRANRIGIRVDFPGGNGTPAFATYSGVADHWNEDEDTFPPTNASTSGGFLASCGPIHWLFDNKNTGLPLAWDGCTNAFSGNFDLDVDEDNGSNWRADTTGWVSASFQTYCGEFLGAEPIPSMSWWSQALAVFALALVGVVAMRRRPG